MTSCNSFLKSETEKYFENTFELIENNSIKKNELNWNELKKTVKDSVNEFNSNYDVHKAISYTIKLIKDGHSIFGAPPNPLDNNKSINAKVSVKKGNNSKSTIPPIISNIISEDIGYIQLSGIKDVNDSIPLLYTMEIRKKILALDNSATISGWIIDLRKNGGGNLYCESLGLSPLFKDSLIGIFYDNHDALGRITCTNNHFKIANLILGSLSYDSTLYNKNKKIAVLVSEKTGSAGEFLASAFQFQENTKLFGKKTKGKTSHCRLYMLKDGAILALATYGYCDINGKKIKGGIIPDVECETEKSMTNAIEWITNAI